MNWFWNLCLPSNKNKKNIVIAFKLKKGQEGITPFRKTLNATFRGRFEITCGMDLGDGGIVGYLRVCRIFGGGRR